LHCANKVPKNTEASLPEKRNGKEAFFLIPNNSPKLNPKNLSYPQGLLFIIPKMLTHTH